MHPSLETFVSLALAALAAWENAARLMVDASIPPREAYAAWESAEEATESAYKVRSVAARVPGALDAYTGKGLPPEAVAYMKGVRAQGEAQRLQKKHGAKALECLYKVEGELCLAAP